MDDEHCVYAFLCSVYAVFDTVNFLCNKSKLSSSTQVEDVEIGLFRQSQRQSLCFLNHQAATNKFRFKIAL